MLHRVSPPGLCDETKANRGIASAPESQLPPIDML
jgi:hypothetical protein